MKEFFDRNYYAVLDQLNGRPYVLMISAGTDGAAAVRQAERICTAWRLNAVAPPLIVKTGAATPQAIAAPQNIRPEAKTGRASGRDTSVKKREPYESHVQ